MAILIDEGFDGGSNGAAITAENTTADLVFGSPTFSDIGFNGGQSAYLPASGSHGMRFPHADAPDAWYAMPVRISAVPTAHGQILQVADGSVQVCDVQVAASTGALRLRDGYTLTATTTTPLVPLSFYQLAMRVRPGVGLTLRLYDADGDLLEQITGSSGSGAAADTVRLQTASATQGIRYSRLRADNATEPAPYVAPSDVSHTSAVLTTSGWVPTRRVLVTPGLPPI